MTKEETFIERTMREANEAKQAESLRQHNFVCGLMNWRPAISDTRKKGAILIGHTRMLQLLARANR